MLSTNEFKRYYEILGVSQTATLEEVKQAYRLLARQYHPDLNAGNKEAEESFKLINEAYQLLCDRDRSSQPSPQATSNPARNEFNLEEYSNFNDFIYDLLGYFLQDPATGKQVYTSRHSQK